MALPKVERYNTHQRLDRRFGRGSAEIEFLALRSWNINQGPWQGGDSFEGDTLWGGYQSTASGANSVAAAISTGVVNGAALLDAGDANAGRSDLSWGRHYRGDLNALYVARFSMSSVTSRKFEIGFTDVISGTDAGAVNVKATNGTWRADDAVVLCFDTDDDTLVTLMGVKATVAATSADFTSAEFAIAAATYYYFGVALQDDNAYGFILDANGRLIKEHQIAAAVTATVLLTPWLFVQNRAGSAGSMTVDWHMAQQFRTTAV